MNALVVKLMVGVPYLLTNLETGGNKIGVDKEDKEWSITNFLNNLLTSGVSWVNVLILIFGLALMGWGAYKILMNFFSGGKQQISWVMPVAAIVIGGIFFFGGLKSVGTIASGGKSTIDELGKPKTTPTAIQTTIYPMLGSNLFDQLE